MRPITALDVQAAQNALDLWTMPIERLADLRDRHSAYKDSHSSQVLAHAAQLTLEARRPGQSTRAPWIGTETLS